MYDFRDSQYFEELPKPAQESIMQSGANFESEEEFIEFVTRFENGIN